MKEQNTISNPFITFFTLIFGLVFITSSCQQANRETAAAQNEALAMQYIEAFNAQDRAALEELLADPQTDEGEEITREAYLERAEGLWDVFPDMEFEPTHVVGAETLRRLEREVFDAFEQPGAERQVISTIS